jgi:hypothetical protein
MTIVKFNNKPSNGFNLLDNFFNDFPTLFKDDLASNLKNFAPVNIKETKEAYELEVGPGFERTFNINLEKIYLPSRPRKKVKRGKRMKSKFSTSTAIAPLNAHLV